MMTLCIILTIPIAWGEDVSRPIDLSIEVVIAGVQPFSAQDQSFDGGSAEFKIDKTYSVVVKTDIGASKTEEYILLEARFYEKGDLILSPTILLQSGELFTYTADANSALPTQRKIKPIVEWFQLQPTMLAN